MILAIDTETSWKNYVNIPFIATVTNEQMKTELFDLRKRSDWKKMKEICEDPEIGKVWHNSPYDITCLSNVSINTVGPHDDTMLMANILNENYESKSLKALAKIYLDEPCLEDSELSKVKSKLKREAKKKGIEFSYDQIPADILYPYAKKDTEYTMRLFQLFSMKIERFRDVYNLELSLIPIIVHMQQMGMRIDRRFCKNLITKLTNENNQLVEDMTRIAKNVGCKFVTKKKYKRGPKKIEDWDKIKELPGGGVLAIRYEKFNPSSVAHVQKVLGGVGVEIPSVLTVDARGNEKEKVSTDMDTLKKFTGVPFVDKMLKYRFNEKQLSTYYIPLYYKYTGKENDRAHFSFFQSGAKSGRFSAKLIQTIPRREDDKGDKVRVVRNAFIPAEGYTWVTVDQDQVEMRWFAHFSNNKLFIQYLLSGGDPHLQTALEVWPELNETVKDLEKLTKKNGDKKKIELLKDRIKSYRKKAKGINFGIIYGMGQNLLAETLGVHVVEARDILARYDERYNVRDYIQSVISSLYHSGYVSVCLESPRMKMYREYRVPQELAYKACNIMVQGTSAYAMKFGMVRCWEYIQKNKKDIRILGTIHDELIFEISNDLDIKAETKKLVACMEDRVTARVPILASPKISTESWGAAKDVKL